MFDRGLLFYIYVPPQQVSKYLCTLPTYLFLLALTSSAFWKISLLFWSWTLSLYGAFYARELNTQKNAFRFEYRVVGSSKNPGRGLDFRWRFCVLSNKWTKIHLHIIKFLNHFWCFKYHITWLFFCQKHIFYVNLSNIACKITNVQGQSTHFKTMKEWHLYLLIALIRLYK